jgi:2-isopropylmalate synthase
LSEDEEFSSKQTITVNLQFRQQPITLIGEGNGPIDAFLRALNLSLWVHSYEERSMTQGSDATAVAYIELSGDCIPGSLYGVGIHSNIVTASLLAVLSGVNRAIDRIDTAEQKRLLSQFLCC